MFQIDNKKLEGYTKLPNSKKDLGNTNMHLFQTLKCKVWNLYDHLNVETVYMMSQWILSLNRWLSNHNYENRNSYKRGQIIIADLGATNFRYEPSFAHPCIVLVERKSALFVVPCSSKKFGKQLKEVIDATVADGFRINTGVQVEAGRWIHRNRIVSNFGNVNRSLLDKIDEHLIKLNPTARTKIASLKHLNNELSEKDQKIEEAEKIITSKDQEILALKTQIEDLEIRYNELGKVKDVENI